MKKYFLILFLLLVSIIVILKLITSPTQVIPSRVSPDMKRYDTEGSLYQNRNDAFYNQSVNGAIDDRKLEAFARAFVKVQSYMNRASSKASYKETSKIVQNYGLSVEDYTKIASKMNENSDFQTRVQRMINEVN